MSLDCVQSVRNEKVEIWKWKFGIDRGIFLEEEEREENYLNKNKRENNYRITVIYNLYSLYSLYIVILF